MLWILLIALVAFGGVSDLAAQTDIDTTVQTATGETAAFYAQIPANYSAQNPPAILVWWHGLGGTQHDPRDAFDLDTPCNARGWIVAAAMGPNDRHWNTARAQAHVTAMLDWIYSVYPFSRDSIYMGGGSMGGAGGQVWHVNHCGSSDYLIAATVGGSQILDCELRQIQYLDSGHVNNSMHDAFGGWPNEGDSVTFEYRRASAIYFADTTKSPHFNALHLPVYNVWGTSDSTFLAEWFAYGRPAQKWDSLRQADGADCTFIACSGINGHGYQVLSADSVVRWLSGFSVNRYPTHLSLNADEAGEYYWTRVTLADTVHHFGRYGVDRDDTARSLDINLVDNIAGLTVEFLFPWTAFDSLRGHWLNRDSVDVQLVALQLTPVPPVSAVRRNGEAVEFSYSTDTLRLTMPPSGDYVITFGEDGADARPVSLPQNLRLSAAYPNPFNSRITLEVESPRAEQVELLIFDVLGRLAGTRMISVQPGTQRVTYDAAGLSSGIYFARLNRAASAPVKMMLIK